MGKCSLWFCHADVYALDLCSKHYHNANRNGGQVLLDEDARSILSHVQRTQVLIANIVEQCWDMQLDGYGECRYCGWTKPNHSPRCIVPTAESLVVK